MKLPQPDRPFTPTPPAPIAEARLRAWMQTRSDIAAMGARVQYLTLLARLGVRRA